MNPLHEQMAEQTIELVGGKLTGHPGSNLCLYRFHHPGSLPEIGRRGEFVCRAGIFPARLVDRRWPMAVFCLTAGAPLTFCSDGIFRFAVPHVLPPGPPVDIDSHPAGTALFLDPRDGWIMNLAEASGRKSASFKAEHWPKAAMADLPARLASSGITFVWRQQPEPEAAFARPLIEHFGQTGGKVLVAGSAPADLEPLARIAGAIFPGPAPEDSPLHHISVYTKIQNALAAREAEQNRLRGQLADLQRQEAAIRAEQSRWDNLADLEARFLALREVTACQQRWDDARRNLDKARQAWDDASIAVEQKTQGLLGWLRKGQADEKSLRIRQKAQNVLEVAENAMTAVRQEEEQSVEEALNISQQLAKTRQDAKNWPAREELAAQRADLKNQETSTAHQLVAVQARPLPTPDDFLAAAELVLALTADLAPGEDLAGCCFAHVLALISCPPDHSGRLNLAALALTAEKTLTIAGDFTHWPIWSGAAPQLKNQNDPAWACLTLAEEASPMSLFFAEGGLFAPDISLPSGAPLLRRLELGETAADPITFNYIVAPSSQIPDQAESESLLPSVLALKKTQKQEDSNLAGCGLGLRAAGDIGPANPVSGLMAAQAALDFARDCLDEGPAVAIVTASPAQSLLINKILADLEAPAGRITAGEPLDFSGWPKVPLVILEPAFEAPHLSHPWAWPSFGGQQLTLAFRLAEKQIWLAGRAAWMSRLPGNSPLAALWQRINTHPAVIPSNNRASVNFWETLDQAKSEVWAIVPAFEPFWWQPLEEHFLAAARRRAKVTVICAPPGPGNDKEYAGKIIKTLGLYGCSVHLATGFPGFMALVDGAHLTWGHFFSGIKGAHIWGGLKSAILPTAAPEISRIIQLDLINEKMGRRGGGLKICQQCGWPLMLINQVQACGFFDEQPLKLGCMGGCHGNRPRRLDEREPFQAPPKCGLDRVTPYQRRGRGRQESWVCPNHPASTECPDFRVVPGDVK